MNAVTRSQAAVVRPRAASRRAAQVVCQAAPEQAASRRTFAAALFAAPILAAALPAAALILDDEDLELLEKAKAQRKTKLIQEKATEREFVEAGRKKGGAATGKLATEIGAVQTAINNLSKSGALLEAGKVKEVPALIRAEAPWVRELKRATSEIGGSDQTKKTATAIFDGLSKLEKSAGSGDAKGAKADYVEAVVALEAWTVLAGLSDSVKGL